MEHAKKMILIEPRVLESMQQQQQQQQQQETRQDYDTTSRDLKETDQSMQAILESDGHVQDKANAFQQALRGFLNRFDEYKNRPLGRVQLTPPEQSTLDQDRQPSFPPPPTQKTDAVEEDVMISVPANLKKRAARILQRLKADPDVRWNNRGEFEYRGRLIKNSNLTDLVNDVLKKKRISVKDPRGWETFAQALQRLNVPQDLIANNSRWSYMRKQDELDESLEEPSTPPPPPPPGDEEGEESFVTPPRETPKSKSEKKRIRSTVVKRLKRKTPRPVNWTTLFEDSIKD